MASTKREDLETQAFIEHYEKKHVPLVCSLAPMPIVYKRNYLKRGDELNIRERELDFDVVTELVFPDRATFTAWMAHVSQPAAGGRIAEDEARFLDRSRTKACVIEEYVTAD